MDWLDQYLDGLSEYKTTVSPADTHIWGVKPKLNNVQERMIFDAAAQSEQEFRQLVQEARHELEAHGMSHADVADGIGADPGSPARASSPSVTPSVTPSITPTITPTPTPTITPTPTPTPVPYPNNAAGPITMVSTKTSGNTWFGVRSSTGYAKTTWWDGSSQVDGNGYPPAEFIPLRTTVAGTKTIYLNSFDGISGAIGGDLTTLNMGFDLSFTSLCAYGCSSLTQIIGVGFQNNLSAVDVRGCSALASLQMYNNSKLTSVLLDGCPNLASVNISNNPLLSGSFDFSNKLNLQTLAINGCSLSAINVQGCSSLYDAALYGNKFKSLDLSNLRSLFSLNASNCANLSSVILSGSTGVSLSDVNLQSCNLSAVNMSALSALYRFNVANNKITSGITLPPAWGGKAGFNSYILINFNNMSATDLNNFFSALGTYIGSYDYYGIGGVIYYGVS